MRTSLLFLLLHTVFFIHAQERCATANYLVGKQKQQSIEALQLQKAEDFVRKNAALKNAVDEAVIRIPVVVHILYSNAEQNISVAQVKSAIDALNRDFRKKNADTLNTPDRFQRLAADVQIEFYLATATPQGRATTGIERKATTRTGWMADDKVKLASQGGLDAWDSKQYLNIWICNLIGGSGYASAPGADGKTDGVVINYNAFGTVNTVAPFHLGRTAVHEVGHWLGLKHIWGDASCGDDGVEDTPQQGFYTKGCPSEYRSSCNNNPAGDMYMNYMDYTNDACMNLFTLGQKGRMRSLFKDGGPRASLLQSKGLNEPWLVESFLPTPAAGIFPNPAQEKITLQVDASHLGKNIQIVSSQGQVIRNERITALQQTFPIDQLGPGVYFLKGEGIQYKFIKL